MMLSRIYRYTNVKVLIRTQTHLNDFKFRLELSDSVPFAFQLLVERLHLGVDFRLRRLGVVSEIGQSLSAYL